MSKRITIVFDDEILKKLRRIHATRIDIAPKSQSISFSSIVNETLRLGLK